MNKLEQCPRCPSMMKEGNNICSKCKWKECETEDCGKFIKRDAKYNICYSCHSKKNPKIISK